MSFLWDEQDKFAHIALKIIAMIKLPEDIKKQYFSKKLFFIINHCKMFYEVFL